MGIKEIQENITKFCNNELNADINDRYVNEWIKAHIIKHKAVNNALGLNAKNNYTHWFNAELTAEQANDAIPVNLIKICWKLGTMLELDQAEIDYSIMNNTIEYKKDGKKYQGKLTKILSKNRDFILNHFCLSEREFETILTYQSLLRPKRMFISTSPERFVKATYNATFTSCFNPGGEYHNSVYAYGNMDNTLICGTMGESGKLNGRSWIFFDKSRWLHKFYQMYGYGNFGNAEKRACREEVHKLLQKNVGVSNNWYAKKAETITGFRACSNAYIDDHKEIKISSHGQYDELAADINIGDSICLSCGTWHADNGTNGVCEECDDSQVCCDCGEPVGEDYYISGSGYTHCLDCYYERYERCSSCEGEIDRDDAYGFDGDAYCENCFNEVAFVCDKCGEIEGKDNMFVFDGDAYCEGCIDRVATRCDDCGEYVDNSEITQLSDSNYCKDCIDSVASQCTDCEETFLNSELNSDMLCEDCYESKLVKA